MALDLLFGVALVLGVLILVHEWGHFIVARLFGVRVDVFFDRFRTTVVRLEARRDGLSSERAAAGRLRAHGGTRSRGY